MCVCSSCTIFVKYWKSCRNKLEVSYFNLIHTYLTQNRSLWAIIKCESDCNQNALGLHICTEVKKQQQQGCCCVLWCCVKVNAELSLNVGQKNIRKRFSKPLLSCYWACELPTLKALVMMLLLDSGTADLNDSSHFSSYQCPQWALNQFTPRLNTESPQSHCTYQNSINTTVKKKTQKRCPGNYLEHLRQNVKKLNIILPGDDDY